MTKKQAQAIADKANFIKSKPTINDEDVTIWEVILDTPVNGIGSLSPMAKTRDECYNLLVELLTNSEPLPPQPKVVVVD